MESLCCSSIKSFRDRPNQPHESKFFAFLQAYPKVSKDTDSFNHPSAFIIQLVESKNSADEQTQVRKRYIYCYYDERSASLAEPSKPIQPQTKPALEPSRPQPYRPPVGSLQAEGSKRSISYGSGWRQQRGNGDSSFPPSRPSGSGYLNGGPKRTFGAPTWIQPDVADSKTNWRSGARPTSSLSTSSSYTSSGGPRSPSGKTQFSGFGRGGGNGIKRTPYTPKSPGSVISQSDTSTWETASNATNSTLQNRFALLRDAASGATSEVDDDDSSEVMDSAHLDKMVGAVIDDDEYFPPLPNASGHDTSPVFLVEMDEGQFRKVKGSLSRSRTSKLYTCPAHSRDFELEVYVSDS